MYACHARHDRVFDVCIVCISRLSLRVTFKEPGQQQTVVHLSLHVCASVYDLGICAVLVCVHTVEVDIIQQYI